MDLIQSIRQSLVTKEQNTMFSTCPIEIVEQILFYLSFRDILSVFTAFNQRYDILSDYFWKTVCLKYDFSQAYETQPWYKSFQSGVNKKLGYYVKLTMVPTGTLVHVYLRSLITCVVDESGSNRYNVYFLDKQNNFTLTQTITEEIVMFQQEFILVQRLSQCLIYNYNYNLKIYDHYKTLSDFDTCIFGISSKYCVSSKCGAEWFNVYILQINDTQRVNLPQDIKFVIDKKLHNNVLVISALTLTEGYKIKVYDILSQSWTLDLFCYNSTGISNDPNVWVGSNFIGCCNVSYRLRVNYFGPFRVWNKEGIKIFQTDIEASTKHYIRCFFKEEHTILTTSDNIISVFNSVGEIISRLLFSISFLDIRLNSGDLLFILLEDKDMIRIYDWRTNSNMYCIKLNNKCGKFLCSDFLYCPINIEGNDNEVIKFF